MKNRHRAEVTQGVALISVPRAVPERIKGAAFAHEVILDQHDGGQTADQIQARHDAAVTALTEAARDDAERDFLRGFAGAGQRHIATLRALSAASPITSGSRLSHDHHAAIGR